MKTNVNILGNEISIKAAYIGKRQPLYSKDYVNTYRIYIKCNGVLKWFQFHGSVNDTQNGKTRMNEQELIFAFYCFCSDSMAAENSLDDFINEFGYEDPVRAHSIFKACEKSSKKFYDLFPVDIYDFMNELQEKYEDCL